MARKSDEVLMDMRVKARRIKALLREQGAMTKRFRTLDSDLRTAKAEFDALKAEHADALYGEAEPVGEP